MVSFFLIISFLLHFVLLFSLFQLLKKVQKLENETDSKEIVEMLENSLEEIKRENNRLQLILNEDRKRNKRNLEPLEPKEQKIKNTIIENEEQTASEEIDHLIGTSPGYKVEASLESQVLKLYADGLSIDEIAKKLDCGKTEAELIIKFYHK